MTESESGQLGRKHIKSFASGIAHMFASSAQHYAWLAHKLGIPMVTIDLIELRIEPFEFNIDRNRVLAEMCQRTLFRNIERLTPPGSVVSAALSAQFGIDDYSENSGAASIGESIFSVILTDDQGKKWHVEHVEKRILIQN
ncbi:MAG: hypothetical protein H0S80_10595 [Desulfovibrionaceae bacterium]|nr:hypothetical protein [Desulfovibrionaceae bacterium]